MLEESSVRSYCRSFPVTFKRALGSCVYDESGRSYIDFLSCCGSLNYGHNHPAIREPLLKHIQSDGLSMSLDLTSTSKNEFLEAFYERILSPLGYNYKAQFTGPTGTNAVEAAIKLARKVTGRTNVIGFTNAFHGCTLGSLALTANRHHRTASTSLLTNVTRVPFDGYFDDDTDTAHQLDRLLSDPSSGIDEPAAIIVEAIQGEGGINAASAEWLRSIESLAAKHGALLILDDIQAGCGRSGDFFSFEHAGIKPDMVVLAKSLSGYGLPLSLVLLNPEIDKWEPGEHNGTFRGNNLAFVTASAAFNNFWAEGQLRTSIDPISTNLSCKLEDLATKYGAEVKGRGMMLGLEFKDPELVLSVQQRCFELGLILETCGPNDDVLKFLPPLTIQNHELTEGLEIVSQSIAEHSTAVMAA